jgi:hypothetical protein
MLAWLGLPAANRCSPEMIAFARAAGVLALLTFVLLLPIPPVSAPNLLEWFPDLCDLPNSAVLTISFEWTGLSSLSPISAVYPPSFARTALRGKHG